jgi:hypothetical protein
VAGTGDGRHIEHASNGGSTPQVRPEPRWLPLSRLKGATCRASTTTKQSFALRQWVLTFPFAWRKRLAWTGAAQRIDAHPRHECACPLREARPSARCARSQDRILIRRKLEYARLPVTVEFIRGAGYRAHVLVQSVHILAGAGSTTEGSDLTDI